MLLKKIFVSLLFIFSCNLLPAQERKPLQEAIRALSKETDPKKAVASRDHIIKEYKLDSVKDAETIDMLNGQVAVVFVIAQQYASFEHYIGLIKNRFNQTSMMSTAANTLLDKGLDAQYALRIARETIEKYQAFKDDPAARPEDFSPGDWQRFMDFAQYPYYDTYARALFAVENYREALRYQQMAFFGEPEEGIPTSVERYAALLELNGESEKAKQFLLKIARLGRLSKGMSDQLERFYVAERGSNEKFQPYLDSLQQSVKAEWMTALRKKMLNKPAPAFTLKDLKGNPVRLSDFKGKIVVLDLWATWCAPCIASFPAMQKEVEKHPDVVFLFIAVDEKGSDAKKRVRTFISKHNYPFRVLMDEPVPQSNGKYKITSAYKPDGIPAKYFIDKSGKLRFQSGGFSTDAELVNEIDAMIGLLKEL